MKLPLRYGLPGLAAIWLAHTAVADPRLRLLLLVAAMVIALWTAFSLNIAPRREGDRNPDLHIVEGADEHPSIGMLGESRGPRLVPDEPGGASGGNGETPDDPAEDEAEGTEGPERR